MRNENNTHPCYPAYNSISYSFSLFSYIISDNFTTNNADSNSGNTDATINNYSSVKTFSQSYTDTYPDSKTNANANTYTQSYAIAYSNFDSPFHRHWAG